MKVKNFCMGCIGLLLLLVGCDKGGVDRLRFHLLEERLVVLEVWQKEVNVRLEVLQGLLDALRQKKYITSVTAHTEGYKLVLNDQTVFILRHGLPGADGKKGTDGTVVMPSISMRDSSDGHFYWVVNGMILKDKQGKAVRADGERGEQGPQGAQGEQGNMGIVPQVRIDSETEVWEISTDGGLSWNSTGVCARGARGEIGDIGVVGPEGPQGPVGLPGDAIFAENGVNILEEAVEFILMDGTKFYIPLFRPWKLTFPEGMEIQMEVDTQKDVFFTITGSGGFPVVDAAGDNGMLAEVEMNPDATHGCRIILTASDIPGKASVLVLLSNGHGYCRTYLLDIIVSDASFSIRD